MGQDFLPGRGISSWTGLRTRLKGLLIYSDVKRSIQGFYHLAVHTFVLSPPSSVLMSGTISTFVCLSVLPGPVWVSKGNSPSVQSVEMWPPPNNGALEFPPRLTLHVMISRLNTILSLAGDPAPANQRAPTQPEHQRAEAHENGPDLKTAE